MPELHPSDERLTDLALSDLDTREQDALTAHLARCESCRHRYSAIADNIDGILAAAPSVAPPPGFLSGVLAELGLEPGQAATPRPHGLDAGSPGSARPRQLEPVPSPGGPRPAEPPATAASSERSPAAVDRGDGRRRGYLLAALAAVLALLVGAAGTALVLRAVAPPPAASPAGVPFLTAAGDPVGSVQAARYEGAGVLVVSVAGPPGASYDCRVELADGSQKTLASWTLPPDGTATWVMDLPGGGVTRMDLVKPSGSVWASAEL